MTADSRNDFGDTKLQLPCYVAGQPAGAGEPLEVRFPYDHSLVGTVRQVTAAELESACAAGAGHQSLLTRHQRHEILQAARQLLAERTEQFARLICLESGLCLRETRYEAGRAQDVLHFAAMEALRDDGQIFSGDVSPQGRPRKIFTIREPLRLAAAVTPFNHPLNQVAHKLAPAVAANVPVVLKPSEKTPLTAIRFAELLYEAGLPGPMLSVVLGPLDDVVRPLVRHPLVELVSFTGSVAVGREIAATAGYRKLCLELGGNSPLIVLEDADLDLAATLAAEGCYRNSGQRCTAVKRLLVHRDVLSSFTERLAAQTQQYVTGDPRDEATRVGTVIDQAAAELLERRVQDAVARGADVVCGGQRRGAMMPPTVIADVPRDCEMVMQESFGPLAPILPVDDIDDAIQLANATPYGLSSGVVTGSLQHALRVVREIRTGAVNVNQVPGYRIELSPFGGVKDSGLGVKEGVQEAVKYLTYVKTFSLPWA